MGDARLGSLTSYTLQAHSFSMALTPSEFSTLNVQGFLPGRTLSKAHWNPSLGRRPSFCVPKDGWSVMSLRTGRDFSLSVAFSTRVLVVLGGTTAPDFWRIFRHLWELWKGGVSESGEKGACKGGHGFWMKARNCGMMKNSALEVDAGSEYHFRAASRSKTIVVASRGIYV